MPEEIVPPVAAPAAPAPTEVSLEPIGAGRLSVPASVLDDDSAEPLEKTPAAATPGTVTPPAKAGEVTPPAKPAETPAPKPGETPAPKAGETPAAPAKPAEPAKSAEAKVKVGDKEYTVAELEKLIANPPAKTPAPAPAAAPAAPAAKAPTPEEIAAQKAETTKQEATWVENFQKTSQAKVQFSKDEVEVLLEGGEPAAKLLSDKLNPAIARAVLETRQSIYNELNPYFEAANAAMAPILNQQVQLEQIATEQVFVSRHPDFSDYLPKAREVATALVAQYPKETQAMSREQFVDEVRAQTDRILQAEYLQFHPGAKDTYRDAVKAAKAAQAPAAPAATAAAAPAAPAAPAVPAVKPPGTNAPGAISAAGNGLTPDQNWHKQTAASLVD
jgi:hypothetical protein